MTIHFNIPLYFALITYYKHFRASKDMQLFHYHSTEGPLVEQQWSFDIWYASVRKIEEQLLVCNCIPKEEKLLIFKISTQDLGFNFKLNHFVFFKFFLLKLKTKQLLHVSISIKFYHINNTKSIFSSRPHVEIQKDFEKQNNEGIPWIWCGPWPVPLAATWRFTQPTKKKE